ncbi:M20/M25/M40 family metallo-hydrolase [Leuconostoc fallax]|uniref:Peptidase M20 dimerisation domain-containing protein n=1 Tax=Leuconostoc fallax TaxID=1251 RepID=A0A4R5N9Z1_9LACO|nr:M20/M25/M40 family metallo-hydrolase [Leuconostoc fallax]MBU7456236.1 M20/M25/M40 family metallo-hydrolase [Leuconostoc fallax]TDG69061.1 hypothetical protein C5L23_001192 [Leuconostoc fallax]
MTQSAIRTHYLQVLKDLIAIPSVSAKHENLDEAANFITHIFESLGAEVIHDNSFYAPFIIAKFKASVPDAKTVIIYNHYDVQPAEPLDQWRTQPWELTEADGHLWGRGVNDDKGNLIARITALVEYLTEHDQQLPVNIVFVVEGAEEFASKDLTRYLDKYQSQLKADLVIWESGDRSTDERVEVSGGTKGIVTFDVTVQTADIDLHSSLSAVVDSAAWRLTRALATLYDDNNHVAVKGFYDDVLQPNAREKALVAQLPLTSSALVEQYHLAVPLLTQQTGEDLQETLYFQPSLNIEGIQTGYQGNGVKTVLPALASAKMEARLVPNMSPEKTVQQIQTHFHQLGFDDITVTQTLGESGYRSDMSDPEVLRVIDIVRRISQKEPMIMPTSAGTGPMFDVYHATQAPIASLGIGYAHSFDHAPNENIRLRDYFEHIDVIKALIADYTKKY